MGGAPQQGSEHALVPNLVAVKRVAGGRDLLLWPIANKRHRSWWRKRPHPASELVERAAGGREQPGIERADHGNACRLGE